MFEKCKSCGSHKYESQGKLDEIKGQNELLGNGGAPWWVGASHVGSGCSQATLHQSSHIQEMSLRLV